MTGKSKISNQVPPEHGDQAKRTLAPDALTLLSQALLTADAPQDVLKASLEVLVPTDINGATILLSGGPPEDRYLEITATWEQRGRPFFPIGTRFTVHEYLFQPLLETGRPVVVSDICTDERLGEYLRSALLQAKVKALVALPLGPAPDIFGALLIDRLTDKPFIPETIDIYEAVAAIASSAIEKLWLIQETKQALDKTMALYEISRRLSEAHSIDEILLTVLDSELFGAAGGSIALLEPASAASKAQRRAAASALSREGRAHSSDVPDYDLVFWAAAGAGAENILGMRMPMTEGVVGWVVRENKPALVPDAYADERFYRQMDTDISFYTHSILCAPLRVEGRVIGAIELVDVRHEYLNEEGLRLLDQVAQQVALFVENQRLLAESTRQASDLTRLLEVGRDLASTLDRKEAPRLITSRVLDLVKADGCHLFLLQPVPDGDDLLVPVSSSSHFADQVLDVTLTVGQGVTGRVAQSGVGEMVNRSDLDPRSYHVPGTPAQPESLISVPLIAEGHVIGVMTVTRLGEEEFVEQDLRIVSAMAGYATTMLTNSRLYQQARQRGEELTALNAIVSTASQSLTLEEILSTTLKRVAEAMPGSAGIICLNEPQTGELQLATYRELPESLARRLKQKGMRGTLCEVTAQQGKTNYVPDLTQYTLTDTRDLVKVGLQAYLGTPLIARGQVMGTLSVFGNQPDAFTPSDAALLSAIGQQIGIAVRNARLYEQTEHALAESQALYEASQAIANTLELEDVLQITLNRMTEYVGADQGRVVLFDEELGYGQIKAEYHLTPGIQDVRIPMRDNPSYEILRDTGEVIPIQDVGTHPVTVEVGDMLAELGVKSTLLVPLIVQGRLLGSIGLDATQNHRAFSESEINFCRALADRAALAVDNRSLFATTQSTLRETTMLYQASRDLNQARELQDVVHAIVNNLPIERIDQCLIALIESEADADPAHRSVEIKAMWDHEGDASLQGRRFTSQELPILIQPDATQVYVINELEHETRFDAQSIAALQALGIKSALIIPLMTGETLLGWLLLITHHEPLAFSADQVRPYQALADQAAVAIQNQQLLGQVQSSLREVEMVHQQYLQSEWASFLQSQSAVPTAIQYERGTLSPAQDLWHPLIDEAIKQRSPVALDGSDETRQDNDPSESLLDEEQVAPGGTSLVAPLQVRGQIIGALGLEDPEAAHELTADQLDMIQEIANQVALALENARLLDTTQTSLAETERLYLTTGRLSNAENATEVVQILAQEVQATMGPDFSGNILLAGPDPADRIIWLQVGAHINPAGTDADLPLGVQLDFTEYPIFGLLIGQRDPTFTYKTEFPQGTEAREFFDQSSICTITSIPLVAGATWLGVINITCQEEQIPDERTLRFLENLADRASAVLESSRLYEQTQRHAVQLEAASKVSRAATSILEQDKLLRSVVELIRDHFNYYHAQVFLIDPTGHWAVLTASTGEIGRKLLKRGHALEVGGSSVIGYVTSQGQSRIVQDVDEDLIHFKNDLLLDTRSEMAIPLQVGSRLIGALDVQSLEPAAFTPDELTVLSTLADQLAVAIENARLYEEQLKTAEKLREVDKLKSQFMANMSHELRTPLNSIIGFSRVILKGIDGPITDLQKQDLTAIYSSGQHLLELINNILDLSKIEAGKMELAFAEVDLTDIVNGVMSTAVALVKDKPEIALRHSNQPGLPPINADATRVRQVLLNLVSNASKFTEEGHIEVNVTHDDFYVMVEVKDTGLGIPADKFDVIFKEFEQVDGSSTRAIGGTGLGLPISRHFVEMHGGRIWVESEVDVGSTFTIQLPIGGPQASEEEALTLDPDRRLILAVDDDKAVIQMYRRYLEKQNYQVLGLLESEQALGKARELQPFAILLDLLMPRKDGWTVIQELKTDPETRNIPVIMCSIVDEVGRGFSLGAADYMVKPILEDQLLSTLTRLADVRARKADDVQQVLIIDDTPEDRKLLRRILESASETYHILEATNGVEGIAVIEQQHPDLIVLDLMMPEMDGFAVLEALKANKDMRQIPIIIVTAKELSPEERAGLNGQVAALLQKGLFEEIELFQDVDLALRRAHKYKERTKE